MAWSFCTRASVVTVLSMYPSISHCSWANFGMCHITPYKSQYDTDDVKFYTDLQLTKVTPYPALTSKLWSNFFCYLKKSYHEVTRMHCIFLLVTQAFPSFPTFHMETLSLTKINSANIQNIWVCFPRLLQIGLSCPCLDLREAWMPLINLGSQGGQVKRINMHFLGFYCPFQHSEAEVKWLPFCRQHFQMYLI